MKKLLLTLGSIAAVAAPVASVVACGAPAQKHVKLNEAKINALLPKIKTSVEDAMGRSNGLDGILGVVSPEGDNFKVTFQDTGMTLSVIVTPDGDVTSFKQNGTEMPADKLAAVETVLKGGTIDHSGDSIEKSKFDATTLVKKYVDEVVAGGTPIPTIADDADHDAIDTYNDAATAFEEKYHEQISQDAYDLITGPITLTISNAKYSPIIIPSETKLNDAIMDQIGFDDTLKDSLKEFFKLGVVIKVGKTTVGGDLAGMVEGMSLSSSPSFNWFEGPAGISFS